MSSSVTPDTSAGLPPVPRVTEHPRYVAAVAARDRLAGEVARLEAERSNLQAIAAEQRQQDAGTARRLVDGAALGDVRRTSHDGTLSRITHDLKNARAGLALAEQDLEQATTAAAAELARAFAPHYRQAARRLVVAWVAFIRESHALAEIDMQLGPLHGRAGCECPVPRSGNGDPSVQDAHSAVVLRQLLDAGTLDSRADADLLRGLAVRPRSR